MIKWEKSKLNSKMAFGKLGKITLFAVCPNPVTHNDDDAWVLNTMLPGVPELQGFFAKPSDASGRSEELLSEWLESAQLTGKQL